MSIDYREALQLTRIANGLPYDDGSDTRHRLVARGLLRRRMPLLNVEITDRGREELEQWRDGSAGKSRARSSAT